MTWLDAALACLIVMTLYSGTQRGFLLEVTDWCVFLFAPAVALRWYRWIGETIRFIGWEQYLLRAWAAAITFGLVGIIIVVIGLTLHKDYAHRIPKEINQATGLLLATAKAVLLGWAAMVTVWYLPLEDAFRQSLHTAPIVNQVMHMAAPLAEGYVTAVAPRAVSADLLPEMQKWSF